MTLILAAVGVALIAICLYAVLGGADFGGGVWDLLATGPRASAQRDAVSHAIGPVWEANHVWLIFALVVLFTCFPPAFADIATGLNAPLALALVGIVLRGSAFVFRNYAADAPGVARPWTVVFGAASIVAPFFLGDAAGALAGGRYAWLSPFALLTGVFAVTLCAQIAAVFLVHEAPPGALRDDFRRRAVRGTAAVWIVGLLPAIAARTGEPQFFATLTAPAAIVGIATAFVLGAIVMAGIATHRDTLARIAVVLEVIAILGGWFGAQAPAIVPGRWTLASAASPPATLAAFLIAAVAGSLLLIPSLIMLFAVFKTGRARTALGKS